MSVYPRNMSNFLNRLSGYNKNNVKMNVLGSTTASAGDVIQVDLPTNSIVDLSSLAWAFQVTYAASGGDGAAHLPINAESLINRMAVEVNGQTLVNLTNYNVLYHALLYTTATEDYQRLQAAADKAAAEAKAAQAKAVAQAEEAEEILLVFYVYIHLCVKGYVQSNEKYGHKNLFYFF